MKTMPGKKTLFGLTTAACLSLMALAPRAEACGDAQRETDLLTVLYIGTTSLTVNAGLTIHDLAVERSSKAYGFFETLLTVPQTVIGLALLVDRIDSGWTLSRVTALTLGYTLWTGVLAANGMRALDGSTSESESQPPPRFRQDSPRVTLTPTVVDDGVHKGMGLGLVGSF